MDIRAPEVTILQGDVRKVLRSLPDAYCDCVVTSPPYWGLRDYGVAGQIGLEPTLGEHLAVMVDVFREVRRVLKAHGTVWLNYGDCYAAAPNGKSAAAYKADRSDDRTFRDKPFSTVGPINPGRTYVTGDPRNGSRGVDRDFHDHMRPKAGPIFEIDNSSRQSSRRGRSGNLENDGIDGVAIPNGRIVAGGYLKPKDLCMIPNRLAIALQDDGWWVRSEIIWHKPNPMPESTYDRPTSAHEKVWLLTKSEDYFYNHEAIREPVTGGAHARAQSKTGVGWGHQDDVAGKPRGRGRITRPGVSPKSAPDQSRIKAKASFHASVTQLVESRNARNVWTITPRSFRDAHFACVDQETECLTAMGWRRHYELEPGMVAAQYDVATKQLSWAPVQAVARYDVRDQDMIVGTCRDMDMWLTPNHRTIVQRRHNVTRNLLDPVVIRADELKASHSVPTAAEWLFEGDASTPLEWAELLGWYVAEGHESKDSLSVEIYQSEAANSAKCRRIEELLRQVGAEWTRASCARTWRGRDATLTAYRVIGYAAVRLREMAPRKLLSWGALLWSTDRIAALVDGLILGDGHTRLDGRRCFVQKNLSQCDLFQALAMRLGLSAVRSVRRDGVGVVYVTRHRTRSFRGTGGRGAAPEVRKYTGVVWCPKLPLGTWVARRGGKPFITGNTFPPALAERCVKAGVPISSCSFCGEALPQPTCHGACQVVPPVPGRVLDPFGGAGTVGLVAQRLGVDCTLIELNPEYVEMTRRRLGLAVSLEAAE